ncbi:MAG: BREX-1 system adenine-specific DNA-methyltransferase PglX, partial [Pelodictyon phaeoclathratiforme]
MRLYTYDLTLGAWLKDNYADVKSDLFSAFIVRNTELTLAKGQLGFMSPFVWMFISSYEKLRSFLINQKTITSLVQLEYSGFDGATVPICTFTIENAHCPDFKGGYVRLSEFKGSENQGPKTLEAIKNPECGWFYRASVADFKKIPGSPIAYWAGAAGFAIYEEAVSLKSKNKALTGMRTGDNELFLRRWQEVPWKEVGLHHTKKKAAYSAKKWFPYNKGGDFNKWYGNNELLVNWENDGAEIKDLTRRNYPQLGDNLGWKITNEFMYFKHGITWGGLTSSIVSFRWSDSGALFDSNKGAMMFPNDEERFLILGFLNSTVVRFLLNAVNPTLSTQNSDIDALPWLVEKLDKTKIDVSNVVKRILSFSKGDDNAFETSWDFTSLPLLQVTSDQCPVASEEENPEFQLSTGHYPLATKLSFSYAKLRVHWRETTLEMQRLEEENNRIFIDAYGLQDELTPEVPLNEITLTCNPHYRFSSVASGQGLVTREEELEAKLLADTMKEFISYAVGCMFGRYSLNAPGLILANQGEGLEDYYRIVSNQLSVISNQQEEKADYCTLTSDGSSDSFPPDSDNVI